MNGGYCEFDKSESKGFCVCPRPWTGEKCEDADSSLCWDEYEEKVTSGLTSIEHEEFQSLDEAKKKCDELGASDCNSIIYTNQGQLSLGSKMMHLSRIRSRINWTKCTVRKPEIGRPKSSKVDAL